MMRRLVVLVSLVAAVVLGITTIGRSSGTIAQEATPEATAGHPLVGTWILDTDTADPTNAPSLSVFTSDGTSFDSAADGTNAGVWEATGPRTAAFTLVGVFEEEGFGGSYTARGTIDVTEAGDALTATYSYTGVAFDGTVLTTGEATAEGSRLPLQSAEAVGTPLAEIPTWTPALAEDGATAAATPAA